MGFVCKAVVPAAFALILISCFGGPPLPSYGVVPDFTLTDQTGQTFRSKDKLDGHVWVADFIFTNCMGPCPRMSTQISRIPRQIGDNGVRYVSFTIDPDRDTPAALAEYGKRYGANPERWFLLTGSRGDLKKLNWDTFHLGDVNGQLEHSTRFVLVDKKSRIRGYYDSSDPESVKQLINDIRRLLWENV
jgi:protein SCO1/2